MICPSRHELQQYALGKTDEQISAIIDDHVQQCARCQGAAETLGDVDDTFVSSLRRLPDAEPFASEEACVSGIAAIAELGESRFSPAARPARDVPQPPFQLGQYEVMEILGAGGMGTVYKAMHRHLEKLVALKVLPPDRLGNNDAVRRFTREMRAVGRLNHPNIVAAHDGGEVEGQHFLVMELVDGLDLSMLARRTGPLPIAEACEIVRQTARGLAHAHQQGMVHRDIKPSNLMLTAAGDEPPVVKILDLGLAMLDEGRPAGPGELTATGQMMGTFSYMAPEQGVDTRAVDARADVYSLGGTLFRLLTGESPFPESRFDSPLKLLLAVATQPPPSLAEERPDAPAELVALVDRLLAKKPEDRIESAERVAEMLAPFSAGADLSSLLEAAVETEPSTAQSGGYDRERTREQLSRDSVDTVTSEAGSSAAPAATASVSSAADAVKRKQQANRPQPMPQRHAWKRFPMIATALGVLALLAAVVFYVQTNNGTIVVKIDDPEGLTTVTVDGEDLVITEKENAGEPLRIHPGEHTLHVKRGNIDFTTEQFSLRRGEQVIVNVKLVDGQLRVVRDEKTIGAANVAAAEPAHIPNRPDDSLPHAPMSPAALLSAPATEEHTLFFDGYKSHAVVPSLTFDEPMAFTLEAWLRPHAGRQHVALSFCPRDGEQFEIAVWNGEWTAAAVRGDRQWKSYEPDRWARLRQRVHVAMVYANGRPQLYVDGKAAGGNWSGIRTEAMSEFRGLALGSRVATPDEWRLAYRGAIDEVRLSSGVRYDGEFTPAERFEPDKQTLALYHCDAVTGEEFTDASGHGHHGRLVGARWARPGRLPAAQIEPLDAKWLARLLALSPNEQRELVVEELHRRNPQEEPFITSNRAPGVLEIGSRRPGLLDLTPLRGYSALNDLTVRAITEPSSSYADKRIQSVVDCGQFAGLPLEKLQLHDVYVENLSALSELPLKDVRFYGSCKGIDELAWTGGMQLQTLHAGGKELHDLSPLSGMSSLADLSLDGEPVSDLSALKGLQLQSLGIQGTRVSDLSPLEGMPLAFVNCWETPVRDLSPLQGMKLTGLSFPRSIVDLRPLADFTQLEYLNCPSLQVADEEYRYLADLKKLRTVKLYGSSLGDKAAAYLSELPAVVMLNVCDTKIADAGVKKLACLTQLEELWLNGTAVTDAGVEYLARLTNLQRLGIQNTRISPEGLAALKQALPACEILHGETADASSDE